MCCYTRKKLSFIRHYGSMVLPADLVHDSPRKLIPLLAVDDTDDRDVGAVGQQHVDHLEAAVGDRQVQRRLAGHHLVDTKRFLLLP